MDKLKELSSILGGRIKSINNLNISCGGTSFRRLILTDYRRYKIEIDEYQEMLLVGIIVESDLAFSVNKPDKIFLYNIPKILPGYPYTIYVSDETYNFEQSIYLKEFWSAFMALLNKAGLAENESVFVYNNCVCFFLMK